MKKTFKFIMAIIVAGSSLFYSCETNDLELTENPNSLTPEQADPNLLLNSVQLAYLANMATFNGNGSALTRITPFLSRDYFAGLTGNTLNAVWSRTYSTANADTRGMIPNTAAITALNAAAGDGSLNYQEGVAKTLLAHNMMLLVDYIGDVPFSETNNPAEFPAPNVDAGADVYAAALSLLNEAETLLTGQSGQDLFYNLDVAESTPWITLINTIRMKAALTTGDLATFNALETAGDFISGEDDDFQFRYGVSDVNPDERHPAYANDYTPSGANAYQSNWLMDKMLDDADPRIRYYFYRQNDCTPGASCNPNPMGQAVTELQCSILTAPVHYQTAGFDDIFCYIENGYWGRNFGDDSGTPPDGLQRTAVGVYPAAGLFDDDSFGGVGLGLGGGGAGVQPFILSSTVDFWRAEVAFTQGDVAGAADLIESAITKSTSKVFGFAELDGSRDASFEAAASDGTDYATVKRDEFLAGATADDQWNTLAEEYWVSLFGGAAEAYNFYRRTGYPETLTPNLEPNPGSFPRSFPYAAGEVTANPNISQKADQTVQVFWDNNPPSAVSGGFPASN